MNAFMKILFLYLINLHINAAITEYMHLNDQLGYIKENVFLDKSKNHNVTWAVKQKNIDVLEWMLYDVSDPNSLNYGKYLNSSEIASISSNPDSIAIVYDYFAKKNIKIVSQKLYGEFITTEASISTWENLFESEFHLYKHINNQHSSVYRALSYTLPDELSDHITSILQILPLPMMNVKPLLKKNIYRRYHNYKCYK